MTFNVDEQLAGIAAIKFYLLEETGNWPAVLTDANAGQITFDPEENNIEGAVVPDSIKISDTPKDSANGKMWPISIPYTFKARNSDIEQLLEQYCLKPGVAIGYLNDGTQKLYGTNLEPLYLDWAVDYGTTLEDGQGINITIAGTQSQRPVFYNPPV